MNIIPIESLSPSDIAHCARTMFEAGHRVDDCPYPAESDAGMRWRRAFIALEMEAIDA